MRVTPVYKPYMAQYRRREVERLARRKSDLKPTHNRPVSQSGLNTVRIDA